MSKINIQANIQGKGIIKADLFRHLSPLTLNEILRRTPLQGRLVKFKDAFVYATSRIMVGVEKARYDFKKGEIAFFPSNGAICFFLRDCRVGRPMNLLGRITEGLDILERSVPGDVLSIRIG